MKESKIVLDYLMEHTAFDVKGSFMDRVNELEESYETIPEEVYSAYQELTEYQMWEIIRKMAVEGKKQTR